MSDVVRYAACAVLVALSHLDLRARRLPNPLVAAFGALYGADAWLAHASLCVIAQHAGTALACFAFGAALHAAGQFGGGDVKLASAVLLWAGPATALPALMLCSLAGLLLVMLGLVADRFAPAGPHPSFEPVEPFAPFAPHACAPFAALASFARLWSARRGVPYGVALAFGGGCVVLPRLFVTG
ncbi:prepilin peptidase [Paraburkholderia sediminicola]|uniref:prepilin peptidase n=1 Tax=Paraburkholderia sediminicola TaxID=458836 RepID=UPI0038BDBFE2